LAGEEPSQSGGQVTRAGCLLLSVRQSAVVIAVQDTCSDSFTWKCCWPIPKRCRVMCTYV